MCIGLFLSAAGAGTEVQLKGSPDDYAEMLRSYVDDKGMVDYYALKANRGGLDAFTDFIAGPCPARGSKWDQKHAIAFWINAYNALTLKAIIDHYPIKASFFKSKIYPKNSIRQIPGIWDKLEFTVMGSQVTLDKIEHSMLRADFDEPRIHMALVCAAMGCPPLRNEPFTGAKLDTQLDDQTRRFLSNPGNFRIDLENGIVYLSSIFKWFGKDFIKTYGTDKKFDGHADAQRAVLNFISKYLDEDQKLYLSTADYKIKYLGYDWSLNEQDNK